DLNRILTNQVREDISNGGHLLTLLSYVYDDADHRMITFDANRNMTMKQFDQLGRLEVLTDAFGNSIVAHYDGVNQLHEIDRNRQKTVFAYDSINRLMETKEYDAAGTQQTISRMDYFDGRLQVIETDRRGIQNIKQNDSLGWLVQFSRRHADLANPVTT